MLTERTVPAHRVHLSPDEMELLAQRQTIVAHCPLSNLKLGSGSAAADAAGRRPYHGC
ncbi:MAG: amidohydrolase family protein [Anaerolineae bacterium]